MHKLKRQIEAQLQEIVFFLSLLISFTVFVGGVLFMALTPTSVVYILGHFGSSLDQVLFSTFGLAFFYFSLIALHIGYITNMHVFSFRDFKREYPIICYSFLAHIIIIAMLASLFSVVQIYFELPNSELLNRGSGGIIGNAFGQILYSGLGLYGSVLLLTSIAFGTCITAGFFELHDVQNLLKKIMIFSKIQSLKFIRKTNQFLIQTIEFLLKDQEVATAGASFNSSKQWMSQSLNKANSFFTDHFHINTNIMARAASIETKEELAPILKNEAVEIKNEVADVIVKTKAKANSEESKTSTKKAKTIPTKAITARKTKKKIISPEKKSKK